eukprot:TRINITY_DN8348_c4_g1_i1.p1 TRINITY_DN8348_c4_g1~~TRINITY_DN8348_c4_g1_i1.p1  ORF type:complete len:485 (+),score=97.90 TRINITY_DN8348_c4_g1_i1:208-1455(+)
MAFGLLQAWLVSLYSVEPSEGSDAEARVSASLAEDGAMRRIVLNHLLNLADRAATDRPSIAMAVGQMLYSFFWWGGGEYVEAGKAPGGLSVPVATAALELHEIAVRYAGCEAAASHEHFFGHSCPFRLRFMSLIGVELARQLAVGQRDLARASHVLRRLQSHFERVKDLPFFSSQGISSFISSNQNRDFFPKSHHWPVWPRQAWPSFAHFLEQNYATFRKGLEALLEADPFGQLFRAVALQQQSEMSPGREDWVRLDLVNAGGISDLCNAAPLLRPSCELLATRPEIDSHCTTYLAGAALARLMPGASIKPHFDTHGRLAVHLGLRSVEGASMTVGGQEVHWEEGRAVVFDDTYVHSVQHKGQDPRYVLVAWFCHPCDLSWREKLGSHWQEANPLPPFCGGGGGEPPVPGYGDRL